MKVFAWRGCETMKIDAKDTTIHLVISGWELLNNYGQKEKTQGLNVCISQWRRPPADSFP